MKEQADWKTVTIGDLCDSISATYHGNDTEVILVNTSDVLEGKILNHERVPNENLKGQFKKTFQKNDILYSEIRPMNRRYAFIDFEDTEQYIASTKLMVLRPREDVVLPQFLLAILESKSVIAELQHLAETRSGTFPQITFSTELAPFPVTIPALQTQYKIVDFLSYLRNKILVNTQINDNLQQMAKAIFLSYYSRSCVAVPFTSIIDVLGGGTPKTTNPIFWNGDIPFFTPKDLGNPYTLHTEKYISGAGLEHCNSRLYPINTVFVTARGTVGKVSLAGFPMAMNQSCYALVGKGVESILVYFYALQTVQNLKHKASGAVFDAIVTRDFESENIQQLTPEDSASFCETAKPIFKAIHNNSIENLRLVSLRDALLPCLMSGELDVSGLNL